MNSRTPIVNKLFFHFRRYYEQGKYNLSVQLRKLSDRKYEVCSLTETLEQIIKKGASAARFGDGEMRLIKGESIEFQVYDAKLAEKLRSVLLNDDLNLLVCIPDVFQGLNSYTKPAKMFWRRHINDYGEYWFDLLAPGRKYYNAFITRPYMAYENKDISQNIFTTIKNIWQQKKVTIIEGADSRIGVGNDLFSEVKSINRIICPSKNAFGVFDKILSTVRNIVDPGIILIALGPSATVLACEINKMGLQAIDIGHIDIEYEWYLMKAKHKIQVRNKFTNEAPENDMAEVEPDWLFETQVIKRLT